MFRIACICGSTRFNEDMRILAKELTLQNKIVVMPNVFAHQGDNINDYDKMRLDILHQEKIRMSHEVHVVIVDNYLGKSTLEEIAFAESLQKPITYHRTTYQNSNEEPYCKYPITEIIGGRM